MFRYNDENNQVEDELLCITPKEEDFEKKIKEAIGFIQGRERIAHKDQHLETLIFPNGILKRKH